MMEFRGVELTPEQVRVAMECETPEDLVAACKKINIDITKAEAEKALENLSDINLTKEQMQAIAGGYSWEEFKEDGARIAEKLAELRC